MSSLSYDDLAAGYESSTVQTPYFAYLNERYREILSENLLGLHLSPLLDVGCGTGLFMEILSAETSHYIGIDLSKEMLRRAKLKRDGIGKSAEVSLVRADAAHIPVKDSSVEGAVSIGMVLPHLSSYHQGLSEISRVLKDRGRFLLEVDNKWSVDFLHYFVDALTGGRIFGYGFSSLRQLSRYVRREEYEWDTRQDGHPVGRRILLRKISVNRLNGLARSLNLRIARFYGVHFATIFIPHSFPRDKDGVLASYLRFVEGLDRRLSRASPFAYLGGSLIILGKRGRANQ